VANAGCTPGETVDPNWHVGHDPGMGVGALFATWGRSPTEYYAVGGEPTAADMGGVGFLHRYDGMDWRLEETADDAPVLYWVYGIDGELWISARFGTVLHQDADGWTKARCDTGLPMWGIWGASNDDVWVVGGDGQDSDPFMCHYDGSAWETVDLPDAGESKGLFKIWGTAADDIWAVGDRGLLLHYDGSAWTQVPVDTEFDLIALWGTGPDEILAVGGRATGVLARYDGDAWVTQDVDTPGLNGVWMDEDGTAIIVGVSGYVGEVATGELKPEPTDSGTFLTLHAVHGLDGARNVAVGGSLSMPPPFSGIIVQRGL
jgi:hypothetical protein